MQSAPRLDALAEQDHAPPLKGTSRSIDALAPVLSERLSAIFPQRDHLTVDALEPPTGAGVNNETLMLELSWNDGYERTFAGCVLRIESDDTLFDFPHFPDHVRLYQIVRDQSLAPVPQVYGLDADGAGIGRPSFFMDRIDGRIPSDRPSYHAEGWVADASPTERRTIWHNAVAAMERVQRLDLASVEFMRRPKLGVSGFEQELAASFDYMDGAMGNDPHPILIAARDWLRSHLPADPPTGFAWGDARPQNLIFQGVDVAALLDWDMASLAGPEADLAWWTVMEYTIATSRGIPLLEGWGTPKDTIALWETLAGRRVRNMDYHLVFAAFRAAIIVLRLAKTLEAKGQLTDHFATMKTNNVGMQYLASLLDLPRLSADSLAWPGLDPREAGAV